MLTVHCGDALSILRTLPDESVQCCVTSPPYWGLRDYRTPGQLGLEKTPEEYVKRLRGVFVELRRVLAADGTLWLNLGDSYAGSWGNYGGQNRGNGSQRAINGGSQVPNPAYDGLEPFRPPTASCGSRIGSKHGDSGHTSGCTPPPGLKAKDLVGIPWMVAFALRADGWYLRSDIIWSKPNPMPESVTDRPTKAHEYIFLLSKSRKYFYDAEAIAEQSSLAMLNQMNDGYDGEGIKDYEQNGVQNPSDVKRRIINGARRKHRVPAGWDTGKGSHGSIHRDGRAPSVEYAGTNVVVRNKRSVWTVTTAPYPDAHFATYPPDLIKPCILAGCPVGGTVIDPFAGSGTTGMVALELGRKAILIELNSEYVKLINQRCNVTPGLALV